MFWFLQAWVHKLEKFSLIMGSIVKGLAGSQNKTLELRIHVFQQEAEEDSLVAHKTEMFLHRCPREHGSHQTQTA